jgi:carbonic anhydrase
MLQPTMSIAEPRMRPVRPPVRQHAALTRAMVAGAVLAAATATVGAAAARWSYSGENGPDRWGALDSDYAACATGRQQSPVDLTTASPRDLADPEIAYQPGAGRITNNGHTLQVDVEQGSTLTVDGVPYQLLQLHFHSPSEHTVDGNSFPVELHLVHQAEGGALAVIGVLVGGGELNQALVPLLADVPGKVGRTARLRLPIDPATLLPADRHSYRYSGSLTTPPCTEGVSWIVMSTPIQAAGPQIAAFARALQGNNRPPQPLAERELLLDNTP